MSISRKRDCVVFLKFNSEFDICMTAIEIVQKLICCVVVVEQGESIVDISEPNRRASVVAGTERYWLKEDLKGNPLPHHQSGRR